MSKEINLQHHRFRGTETKTITAAQLGTIGSAKAQSNMTKPEDLHTMKQGMNTSFGSLKQIDAGVLNGAHAHRRHIQPYERHSS